MRNGVEKGLTAESQPPEEHRSKDAGDPSTPEATIRTPDAPSAGFIPQEAGAPLKQPPTSSSQSEADASANHPAGSDRDVGPRADLRPDLPATWYRHLVENQPDLICGFLPDTTLTYVNTAYARFFGALAEDLIGRRFIDFLAAEDRARVLEQLANMVPASPEYQYEHETRGFDGEPRWHLWHDFALFDDAGRPREFQSIGVDVTERRRVEQALRESEYFLRKSQEVAGLGSYRYDPRADRWVSSTQLDRIFGIDDDYPRDTEGWLALIHPEQRGEMAHYLHDTVLAARQPFSREYRIVRSIDGAERWVLGRGELELDADGAPVGLIGTIQDITERRHLTDRLAYDASHDLLTGLLNRAELERRLQAALAESKAGSLHHTFCYMDLDQFKVINDTAGHAAGDELLKQIARLIPTMIRDHDSLARIGGDELGLLLFDCPLALAEPIARRIVERVRGLRFQWGGRSYRTGLSMGVAEIHPETADTATILSEADIACYIAKQTGRNRYHLYRSENDQTASHHNDMLNAAGVRNTLEQGRLRLYYQPIVRLGEPDTSPEHYEALLRVVPEDGEGEPTLPPGFIGAAERFGLMDEIDRWVIARALHDHGSQTESPGARIAINLSGSSLSDETLLAYIEGQIDASGMAPERICFEITETAGIQNLDRALDLMTALKARGCQLA
ncbi:diguanylate cyclase, partial [Thiocapsa sp.]|uniref:diguanylate cyclase domain-containing protein n=1 Tax=Thiocapsa sp. TaxID=2024551 RepID=UPI0025CEBF24